MIFTILGANPAPRDPRHPDLFPAAYVGDPVEVVERAEYRGHWRLLAALCAAPAVVAAVFG